jgi:hypothetical protein
VNENPRDTDPDLARLDTDYDSPPTRERPVVAKDKKGDRTDPKTGETVSKKDVKKDERMIEELREIHKQGKKPEAQK